MFEKAQVNDSVFSPKYGWGTVSRIDQDSKYPISVSFPGEKFQAFTLEGKNLPEDAFPSIFWDKPQFPNPPKKKVVKKMSRFSVVDTDTLSVLYTGTEQECYHWQSADATNWQVVEFIGEVISYVER